MIYLVTTQLELFDRDDYKVISVEESLELVEGWKFIQVDSETTGKLKILDYLRAFIRL